MTIDTELQLRRLHNNYIHYTTTAIVYDICYIDAYCITVVTANVLILDIVIFTHIAIQLRYCSTATNNYTTSADIVLQQQPLYYC